MVGKPYLTGLGKSSPSIIKLTMRAASPVYRAASLARNSHSRFFIFVNVGSKQGLPASLPPDIGNYGRCLQARSQFYFSMSESQVKWMESGAALASSTFVMMRNRCPSLLTS